MRLRRWYDVSNPIAIDAHFTKANAYEVDLAIKGTSQRPVFMR